MCIHTPVKSNMPKTLSGSSVAAPPHRFGALKQLPLYIDDLMKDCF
jgi:hypothetical protein